MAVASKSSVSVRKTQVSSKARKVAELNSRVNPNQAKIQGLSNPPILLSSRSAPLWFLRLCCLQKRFSAIAFLLVIAMLAVYGWAVYSQKMWTQKYSKLETLQIDERQLTTTNEALKNQMVRQAQQPNTGLIPPNPSEAIVLQPAPPRPIPAAPEVSSTTNSTAKAQPTPPTPLGY